MGNLAGRGQCGTNVCVWLTVTVRNPAPTRRYHVTSPSHIIATRLVAATPTNGRIDPAAGCATGLLTRSQNAPHRPAQRRGSDGNKTVSDPTLCVKYDNNTLLTFGASLFPSFFHQKRRFNRNIFTFSQKFKHRYKHTFDVVEHISVNTQNSEKV